MKPKPHILVERLPRRSNQSSSIIIIFHLQGVLRIHLLEAQNLVAKDNLMGGMVKGKSDPYVKINVGGVSFKSHVIKENLNPTWNEMYEVRLHLASLVLGRNPEQVQTPEGRHLLMTSWGKKEGGVWALCSSPVGDT